MARDEALLVAVGTGSERPTLRFYRWDPPTISLGYFQKFAEYEALDPPAGNCPVVRRLTGGGAILHADELTYSLTLPVRHPLIADNPNDLYVRFHDAVIGALASLGVSAGRCGRTVETHTQEGPFFCFERRHCFDILAGREKIAGSAQRRTEEAVLQHGSIILDAPFAQQPSFEGLRPDEAVVDRLIRGMQSHFHVAIEPGEWSADELAAADVLRAKYLDPAWTQHR